MSNFILTLLFLTVIPTFASVVAPGDGPYYRLRKERTLYIYDQSTRDLIPQVAAYHEAMRAFYDKSFGWSLDEENDLILTSPRQQIANAYATVVPNIKTVWFPSGSGLPDEFAESSWLLMLNAHEVAHLYQLNAKGSFNSRLKKIFGNSIFISPFIWPIFIHPNLFTPTFLVEGNAVLNESRLNMGGRLFSGEKRALVLAQIQAGDINPTRLINDDFRFPYGEESYMQGAYFQAHLAAKYGVDKTNQFFKAQGEHYLWPLILNKTFRDHFGSSYPQEIREYTRNLEGLAKSQQQTPGSPVFETTFTSPLNHDARRIFFLTTSGKESPVLRVFDKATRTWADRQLDIPMGKVFWDGDRPETSATDQHDLHHTEYSLYGEGARFNPNYRGQVVTDQRAGHTVSLDAQNSWLEPRLLLDGEPYDVAHSSAVLSETGEAYYFRQNGNERILYRNREPLAKFEGFYAKPVEVTADGIFYFIGNTDAGSTLYSVNTRSAAKEIVRVLKSDRVVEARWIGAKSSGENEFLVVEVNHRGHAVYITKAQPKPQSPATYSYGFANASLVPAPALPAASAAADERSYHATGQMRYSGADLVAGFSSGDGLYALASATFVDPLEYQDFGAAYLSSEFGERAALAQYSFTKYLPDFFAGYLYQEDPWSQLTGRQRRAFDQEATVGMSLPVWRWRRWDAAISFAGTFEKNDLRNDPAFAPKADTEELYGLHSTFNLDYQVAPSLGFLPWRAFTLNYFNHLETLPGEFTKRYNTSLAQSRYVRGFPMEFYGTLAGNLAWSEEPDIEVEYDLPALSNDIRIPRLTSHNPNFLAKTAGSLRLEVTKVFNLPLYSSRLPIGLNRIAPLVVAQGIFLDDDLDDAYPQNIFEWGFGADIEALVLHKGAVTIRLLNAFDTRNPAEAEQQARLTYKASF